MTNNAVNPIVYIVGNVRIQRVLKSLFISLKQRKMLTEHFGHSTIEIYENIFIRRVGKPSRIVRQDASYITSTKLKLLSNRVHQVSTILRSNDTTPATTCKNTPRPIDRLPHQNVTTDATAHDTSNECNIPAMKSDCDNNDDLPVSALKSDYDYKDDLPVSALKSDRDNNDDLPVSALKSDSDYKDDLPVSAIKSNSDYNSDLSVSANAPISDQTCTTTM